VNNLEAVEKVIERLAKGYPGPPVVNTDDLLRAFRAYDSEVEGADHIPHLTVNVDMPPLRPFNPGDRCPTCGWTVPEDQDFTDMSLRLSPKGRIYADKLGAPASKPKSDTLSEDEYRLLMLRAVRWFGIRGCDTPYHKSQIAEDINRGIDALNKRISK
jgi:hypothetical protein